MKKFTRLIALPLAAALAASALASCSNKPGITQTPDLGATLDPATTASADQSAAPTDDAAAHDHDHGDWSDPSKVSIGKVGRIEFTLDDYLNIYASYRNHPYAAFLDDIENLVLEQLVAKGVALDRCGKLGIEFDDEDEKKMPEEIDKYIAQLIDTTPIDSSITGEAEISEAKNKEFDKRLIENNLTMESFREMLMDSYREGRLIDKLKEHVSDEVEFGDAQIEEYYNTRLEQEKELYTESPGEYVRAFYQYLQNAVHIPLYTPEDMFAVKHLLIQYENFETVSENEPGVFNEEQTKKIEEVRDALKKGITLEEFNKKYVSSLEYNSDEALVPNEKYENIYPEHGYIMNEQLIGDYYPGFGEAACLLYYGENWEPHKAEDDSEPAKKPIEEYGIKFYNTTDGHKIAELRTNTMGGGIHFIFLNKRLESGVAKLDMGNENDPVYSGIKKFGKQELTDKRYEELVEQWRDEIEIDLDEELINHYLSDTFGVG